MRLSRSAAIAAGLTGLLCAATSAAPAALASPARSVLAAAPAVAAAAPVVRGAIGARYAALGGRGGFLGAPLANEGPTSPRFGAYQNFQGGAIFWAPATGAWEVHGAIAQKWLGQRAENGPLGFPTSNEVKSTTTTGSASTFERGVIAWSPASGAHQLVGAILGAWIELGQEQGALGFPTSDEIALPPAVGPHAVVQYFTGAAVYYSGSTGIGVVRGAIRQRWAQLGYEQGALGLPVGTEIRQTDGSVRQAFQGGVLSWSPSTGAVVARVIGQATLDTKASTVIVAGVQSQPFSYAGTDVAFGSQSVLDPAGVITPLTQAQFTALFTNNARVIVVVTHDPATSRNVFTALRDVPSGSPKTGALSRYLTRVN